VVLAACDRLADNGLRFHLCSGSIFAYEVNVFRFSG